ncbi:hypothetical protein ACVQEN_10575 [Stenotrophomonas acidaminiphila]
MRAPYTRVRRPGLHHRRNAGEFRDRAIEDERLRMACQRHIHDRLLPEIEKALQFRAMRILRYLVACYGAEDAGYFRAHRGSTTRGTAHRRFAVSLNLSIGDYVLGVTIGKIGWWEIK